MNDMTCPWCEGVLELNMEETDEQRCPECLTTWRYEEDEQRLPLAA